MELPNLNLIRLFRAVAVRGGVKHAMADLHITQSAISQGLRQLEKNLGVTLAIRTRSEFRLTHAGQIFLASCEKILTELKDTTNLLQQKNKEWSGEYVIACDYTMAEIFFLPWILILRKKHPKLVVHLQTESSTESLLKKLNNGSVDIICINELFIPDNSDVIAKKMPISSNVYLWGKRQYLEQHKVKSKADLSKLTFIDQDKSAFLYRTFFEAQNVSAPPFLNHIAVGMLASECAKNGLGVTIGPYFWLEKDLKKGKINLILSETYSLKRQDSLCISKHNLKNPTIHGLWKELSRKLPRNQ